MGYRSDLLAFSHDITCNGPAAEPMLLLIADKGNAVNKPYLANMACITTDLHFIIIVCELPGQTGCQTDRFS